MEYKDSNKIMEIIKEVANESAKLSDENYEDLFERELDRIKQILSHIKFTPKYPNQKCVIFISEDMLTYLKYKEQTTGIPPKMIGDKPTLFGYELGVDNELKTSQCYLKSYIAIENDLEVFEEDIWRLMEDFPHPKLIIGKYKICVDGDDDYYEHYELHDESGLFIQSFEIPKNIIDFFDEDGFNWKNTDYIILPNEEE